MFLNIFNWMLANAPGFMRPALRWLIDGVRGITNYIAERWRNLGNVATQWWQQVWYWWRQVTGFTAKLIQFIQWLVLVRIPNAIAASVRSVVAYTNDLVDWAVRWARARLAELQTWASSVLDALGDLIVRVRDWAKHWLDRLLVTLSALIGMLWHVLNGPDVLAEWLAAAMWRAFARYLRAQQDRIASWLTRESVTFTRWLTTELENLIMRWL